MTTICSNNTHCLIIDRRAGHISTEKGVERVVLLNNITLPGVEFEVKIAKEYHFALVMRGVGPNPSVTDTNLQARVFDPDSQETANIANMCGLKRLVVI